jgi:RNA polymerase primary sigma factor
MEELGELLNMKPEDVRDILSGSNNHLSMDAPMGEDDGSFTMLDTLTEGEDASPDMQLMEQSLRDEIKYGMASLSPREIQILSAYYGIDRPKPLNLEEIAEYFGLTRERVRQIKDRALRRLKRDILKKNPQLYFTS